MVKYFCVFIKSKNLKHYEKRFQQRSCFSEAAIPRCFYKKGLLKKILKTPRKTAWNFIEKDTLKENLLHLSAKQYL